MGVLNYFWKPVQEQPAQEQHVRPNLGEDLRQVMLSEEVEQQLKETQPFLIAGLTAWPAVWILRGLEWGKMRGKQGIKLYVKKTFFQAKLIQFVIISSGIVYAMNQQKFSKFFRTQVEDTHVRRISPYDISESHE